MNRSDYVDLGQIVGVTSLAVGGYAYSPWLDDLQWVRDAVLFVQNDQNMDVIMGRRDSSGVADYGTCLKAASAATGTSAWVSYVVGRSGSLTTNGGTVGYGCRFGLKNVSASPATCAKLRAQLIG